MPQTYSHYPDSHQRYCGVTRTAFARIYPVIADQIIARTGITKGTCLDVGSGPGLLAIAIALLSDLRVTALDDSPEMLEIARQNIRDRCMEELVVPAIGDVRAIPSADDTFQLVVSRGSFHSWYHLPVAFHEIHRVLRPWGMAYIGGGYGNARIRDELLACRGNRAAEGGSAFHDSTALPKVEARKIQDSVEAAGIRDYRIIDDDSGFWILIRKSRELPGLAGPAADIPAYQDNIPVFRNGFFFDK
jgi:SAM-dependent methyltransferase